MSVGLQKSVYYTGPAALVKCILAGLVLLPAKLGFFEHLTNPQHMLIYENSTLAVSVSGKKFDLGEQIVGPPRDHLAGRSTCVQLAQRIGQNSWNQFFKSSWPYKAREHEGNVLEKFKGISGIVGVLAWDVLSRVTLTAEQVCKNYKQHPLIFCPKLLF